jgi:hypothetical protein
MENKNNAFPVTLVAIGDLKEHPKNYRTHPEDQIEHLCKSITEHGMFRNVVIASDNTILAGHGIVKAAKKLGMNEVPVLKLNILPNDTKALKILTADNEISRMAEVDDRMLSELLKDVQGLDTLLGTGFDEKMLANLIFVTRPASEIANLNEASEWVGMPDFERAPEPIKTIISFNNEADRSHVYTILGLPPPTKKTDSAWWPPKEREDLASIKIED